MVVKNANIHNIMGGMESTGGVRLHNHRRKLKQRFDIIRKLGQGTYGKVQLGINKETGQEVAIKTIKKAKIETEADLIRIRREIQIMSSVQHPNIIHIYEVFENREKMVLVMEYAAGGELYDYLSERKVLPQDEARRIFRQIATAVFYCHKHKICHRDLKLENILLDEHGSAKIADFGLSNVFDEQRLLNTFCGSPLYASPEIVKGTPYHGPEVDCWSLGVLLYTLVYGAMPFDGSNFKRLVKQISQGDYFEPKKPSPASSLIRDMLTVPPAKRADIEKVCSHWWVNEGYSDSCLQIAEELADQTPVRLDLLLSLAPPPSGGGTENIMQQGMSNAPSVPHAMVPTRCHSVGSLMELDHTATEQQQQQQQQRTFGATGKQPLYGDSVAQSAQSTSCATAGHWDSTKRKLEEGASSSEVNLRGAVKRDRGKRKSYEESADVQMSSGRTKHSGENEREEQTTSEVQPEDEKMDIEEISDPALSGAAHAPESMESSELSKDSGVEIHDDSLNTSEMEQTCKSSTVSSTATIIPAEESSSAMPSPDEHVPNEPTLSDNNKSKKPIKKKAESVSDLKMSGDLLKGLEKSRSAVTNEKKDSVLLKEPSKGVSGTKEKQKKVSNAEVNEASKTSKVIAKNDTGNAMNKTSKAVESVVNSSKNISASAGKDEKENEIPKTNTKAVKSKGDLVLENLNSEASSTPNTSEPSTPPAGTMERRRSKIFETADKFNNILSGSPETKNVARDKPKKLFIPGVKVSDFKKAFERKLSSPEISVAAFSKKYPTKSDEITSEKSEKPQSGENENVNGVQKGTSSASEVHENNLKGKPTEGELVQDDSKGKKSKSGRNSQMTEDNKKEYPVDTSKSKSLKSSPESKKSSKSVINKSSDSAVEGRNLETMQPAANTVDSTDVKAKTENDKDQELVHNDKKVIPTETVVSAQDAGNDVTIKPSKPNETAGKKKSSKVEITLKSATLPRRKTSKAEIKLDPAIPPIEYKTEIEHMVNTPTTVPLHIRRSDEEHAVPETTMPFRSWSLEPESPHLGKMPSHECIIPIQIERETREGSGLMSPPVGRPPAYPFQQRSMSQSQRSSTLSRQSTQESDSEVMEPIRKSPREYIIPIAVEGGGYVTPRAGSLEPSASDDAKSRRSMSSSTRSNHYRRMSSLLSDTSEDEGFNMSPGGLQRHGSLSRGRDDGRTFHFHRLRSSRPMRHSLEHNDSLSSAEEDDDDDDDDEGFEILTAESLFSTLLSRVRSLTQRLTVEDGKRPGFPSNHFVNQLSNINNPSTSFKNFYSHHREPLSRRLSETSSFPRLLNRGGDFGPMHQRSLSRDSSNCDSVNSEASCTVGTFPRGPSNQKYNPCDNIRRGTRNIPTSYQYPSGLPRGAGWHTKHPDESNSNNSYLFPESSVMKSSSSGKNLCKLPSHNYHHSPRKLTRTLSLRSTAEDKLFCNSPVEEHIYNKYSDGFLNDKHNQNIDLQLPSEAISTTPAGYKREKLRSSSRQNLTSLSRDFKTPDTPSSYILPPLPQSSISETKCNSIPRPTHVSRIPGQERFNKGVTKNTRIDSYQPQPKHSSSLPSIVEGPKSLKYKGTMTSGNLPLNSTESQGAYSPACSADIKKISDKKLNNSEYSVNNASLTNKNAQSPECKSELKALQNIYDGEECAKNNKIISSQHKDTQSSRTTNSTVSSQSRSLKPGKQSLIPKSSSGSKQGKDNSIASVLESTDKEDGSTVQKRRISRFLRPDFFDTPPEESTYVKEREAKKAAEAEIKKAKRLARRTSSMRETSNIKTDTHDKNNSNTSERSISLSKNDNKTGNTFHKNSEIHLANMENHNEKIKPNPKISKSPLSHSDDKCNKNQTWSSSQKGDVLRTSGSGLCASAKSRVGKAISSLQEHNFTPWDKKIVATESTYLKRAVSVDDVSLKSQNSLIKTNPKLGRKISSVLGLFSKMDNPALENQYQSNTMQNDGEIAKSYCDQTHSQNEVKTSNSLEKGKNKVEEKKQPFGSNISIGDAENGIKNMKQPKSLKDSKSKVDLKKNNKKVAAQVISDALCNTKDPSKKTLNSNPPDLKSTISSTEKIQGHKVDTPHEQDVNKKFLPSNSSSSLAHTDELSNISKYIIDNKITAPKVSSVDNENCEQPSLLVYNESALPVTNDSKYFSKVTSINSENSPADETESVDSWCASSDIDAQENLGLPGDDDDKESESVEDRIRRKSFYSRFNDVKKKGRKKSSQFLKDCRTTLLPTNYHKNDNQAFLPQSSNTGAVSKKLPVSSHTTETHKDLGDTNIPSISSPQNSMPESNKTNEVCSLEGKETSFQKNRILDNDSNAANDNTSNTRALLRPAAFAQSVLKKTSPMKGKTQTQSQDGSTSIPKLSDPVAGASNTLLTSENTKQKEEMATS